MEPGTTDSGTLLPDEAVAIGAGARGADVRRAARAGRRDHLGGPEGNEILTSATAVALTLLLLAEGVTVIRMNGLVGAHMFIGLVLIPPIALKLASTGYRFVRYYTGARPYREKGPPLLPLRLLAPILVSTTFGVFVSGVLLMALGHRSDTLMLIHKASFIVWGVAFGIHFLSYLPRVSRALRADWGAARRHAVPGSGLRAMLVAASLGGGVALALALVSSISAFHGGHQH